MTNVIRIVIGKILNICLLTNERMLVVKRGSIIDAFIFCSDSKYTGIWMGIGILLSFDKMILSEFFLDYDEVWSTENSFHEIFSYKLRHSRRCRQNYVIAFQFQVFLSIFVSLLCKWIRVRHRVFTKNCMSAFSFCLSYSCAHKNAPLPAADSMFLE